MANEKLYKKSMERSQYIEESDAGWIELQQASTIIRGLFNKEYSIAVLKNTVLDAGYSMSNIYLKIIRSDPSGMASIMFLAGSNTSEAVSKQDGFTAEIDFTNQRFESVARIKGGNNSSSAYPELDRVESRVSSNSGRSSNSNRRSKRTKNKRALSVTNPITPDQIELKSDSETPVVPPPVFNTENNNLPPKDFASIFEDANLNLYNENSTENIEIESPPGVAKYLDIGIDVDRPSVICSTNLSPIIYGDADQKSLYKQLALDRFLRIETIFNNLNLLNDDNISGLAEEQDKVIEETTEAIESLTILANLDTDLLDSLVKEPKDIATTLDFASNILPTQLYAQVLYDLGAAPEFGIYKKSGTIKRNLGVSLNNQISIHTQHTPPYFKNSIYNRSLKYAGGYKSIADPSIYQFGDQGSYLGYYHLVEPEQISGANSVENTMTNSSSQFRYTAEDSATHLMQTIYTELLLSKLLTSGDTTIEELKAKGTINIAELLFGSFADTNQTLNSVDNTTGLASILKYNSSGKNYYPLEENIPNGSGINGRTFFDAIIQPAIGALIEDEDPQFDLLNKWVENSRGQLDNFFKYIDPINLDGGSTIVLNEIIVSIVDWIVEPQKTVGNLKHPKSPQFTRQIADFDSNELRALLVSAIPYFARGVATDLGHTYNTLGYAYFPGQQEMLINVLSDADCGFGYYPTHVNDLCLGPGLKSQGPAYGWDPSLSRPINSTLPAILVRNNIYEEISRLFGLIENGIMTSIEILLSKLGYIKQSTVPDYDTLCSGFFVPGPFPTTKNPLPIGQSPGQGKMTAFSGIPLFTLRLMIAKCVSELVETGIADSFENILKVSKCAVENLDETKGPVRWQVTHGPWPQFNPDISDLKDNVYNKLIPSEVVDAFENGPPEVEIEFDSDGNPQAVQASDPTEGWQFINSIEGFCPLTLILDGEDNSRNSLSFTRGNRSLLDNVYDHIISYRSKIYKMKRFLTSPIEAFENFPNQLEKNVGKIALGPIKNLSALSQIDAHEIIKFANSLQIANSRKTLRLESPSPNLNYLPNKYIVSIDELNTARAFVENCLKTEVQRPDLSIIHTVGIPSGYLESVGSTLSYFKIAREAEYMFFPDHNWSQKTNLFHPEIYLIPGSLKNCNAEMDHNTIVNNCRYFISNKNRSGFMDYSQVREYLGLSTSQVNEILKNHVLDYCLQLTLKVTTGINLSEDTFRFNKNANNRFLDKSGLDAAAQFMKKIPDNAFQFLEEDKPVLVSELFENLKGSTANEINMFLGSIDCRLFSPLVIPISCLSPRIFDRVFSMIVHPSQHFTENSGDGLYPYEDKFKISLEDQSINSVKNDHFASYYYRIEV